MHTYIRYAYIHAHTHTCAYRWFEQKPRELIGSVRTCLEKVVKGVGDVGRVKGVGITNQRETTILWDKTTGEPLHNAIGEQAMQYLPLFPTSLPLSIIPSLPLSILPPFVSLV